MPKMLPITNRKCSLSAGMPDCPPQSLLDCKTDPSEILAQSHPTLEDIVSQLEGNEGSVGEALRSLLRGQNFLRD